MTLPSFYHIGFHKTGTTFLQRSIFSRHPDLILRNTYRFFLEEALHERGKGYYRDLFGPAAPGKVVMESSEGLSGEMFGLGNYRVIANRIQSVSPKGKVLLIIRNQVGMIESLYKQYVKERGTLDFHGFLQSPRGRGVLEKVRYVEQIRFYRDLFGDSFRAMLYEDLAKNPGQFLAELYRFIGVGPFTPDARKQNRGVTVLTGGLYRTLNRWCQRSGLVNANRRMIRRVLDFMDFRLWRHVDKRRYIGPSARREISHAYKESNAALAELIGVDLSLHGY